MATAKPREQKLHSSNVEPCHHDSSRLLNLVEEAYACTCESKRIVSLKNCASCMRTYRVSTLLWMMHQTDYRQSMLGVIDLAIVPAFSGREYFSYEKTDFNWYPERTEGVLGIFHNLFDAVCAFSEGQSAPRTTSQAGDLDSEESFQSKTAKDFSAHHYLPLLLPKLCTVIGANCDIPLWSTMKCKTLSLELLNKIMEFFSCESTCELLCMKGSWSDSSPLATEGEPSTLLQCILSQCRKPLGKNQWQQNPFLAEAFHWTVCQVKSPHLSEHIDQIMATSLNFLDDFQASNKIRGISCLHHLLKQTSAEEMRWYNRAEVIFDTLKNQMYAKESTVVAELLPCLFTVLKVLETAPNLEKHQTILETLVRDAEGENLLVMHRVYINQLTSLVHQVGVYSVRHLKAIIRVVVNYLEVDDGLEEQARIDALKLLEAVLQVAWPRAEHHADIILRSLFKFLVDINSTQFQGCREVSVMTEMNSSAIKCFKLLLTLCPEMRLCIETLLETEYLQHLWPLLNQIKM